MHFHCVSAHFGGPKPWAHNPTSTQSLSCTYYEDNNMPSRHNSMHPRLKAKIPKMLEWRFTQADWYIWMDSSVMLKDNIDIPQEILKISEGNPLCLFKHTQRTSIWDEATAVTQAISQGAEYHTRRYSGEPLISQAQSYLNDKTFVDSSLFQMTFFAYHKSATALMQEWFLHNCIWSIQDQISFPYLLHKSGLNYSLFEGNAFDNNIFAWDWKSRESNLATS